MGKIARGKQKGKETLAAADGRTQFSPEEAKKSGKRNAKKKCCCLLPPKAAEKDFFTCLSSHRGNGIRKKERENILHELIVILVFRQNS